MIVSRHTKLGRHQETLKRRFVSSMRSDVSMPPVPSKALCETINLRVRGAPL
jgi:hypothetical protein